MNKDLKTKDIIYRMDCPINKRRYDAMIFSDYFQKDHERRISYKIAESHEKMRLINKNVVLRDGTTHDWSIGYSCVKAFRQNFSHLFVFTILPNA